ncbi:MAG TPA: pyridoxal 5'-phosphate synthase glutaminase subunit PdxT [Thermoanaerobaculia bacterium]
MLTAGVLALQGDFEAHRKALAAAGLDAREVRTASELLSVDALVLPGGESTTMWKLMEGTGLPEAIVELAVSGRPVLATCAGAILLSRRITNPDRTGLGLLDVTTVRNAYGRQLDSTVVRLTDLDREVLGDEPLEAVFIRAPRFHDVGKGVEILARRDGAAVLVRSGNLLAATFHPELAQDGRVHRLFVEEVRKLKARDAVRLAETR